MKKMTNSNQDQTGNQNGTGVSGTSRRDFLKHRFRFGCRFDPGLN